MSLLEVCTPLDAMPTVPSMLELILFEVEAALRDLKIFRGAAIGASGGISLTFVVEGVFECFHHGSPCFREFVPSRRRFCSNAGKVTLGCTTGDDTGRVCISDVATGISMVDAVTGLVCTRDVSSADDASVCTKDDMAGMFMVDVLTGSVCMSDCTTGTFCTTGGAIWRFCITVEEADMFCMPDSAPVKSGAGIVVE